VLQCEIACCENAKHTAEVMFIHFQGYRNGFKTYFLSFLAINQNTLDRS